MGDYIAVGSTNGKAQMLYTGNGPFRRMPRMPRGAIEPLRLGLPAGGGAVIAA
ncbi:MAG TPA: hypothetical protein VF933_10345 [Streptosporangiaceae bacterium]